jgi:tetratricopeptide (TPR) repeat protein
VNVPSPLSAFVSVPLCISLALGSTTALATPAPAPAPETPDGTADTGVTEEQRTEAEDLSDRAIEAFSAEDYATAVELFEKAYEIDPQPNYLFNIGRVHEEAANLEQAVEYYSKFVKQPGVDLDARGHALERLKVLRAIVTETTERPEEPESPGPLVVDPSTQPADDGLDRRRKTMRGTGIGLAATGAGTLIAAAVVGAVARSDSERAFDPNEADSLSARQDFLAQSRTKAITADVLYGLGGALVVTGVVLIALGYSKPKKRRVALTPTFGPQRVEAARAGWGGGLDLRLSF